MKCDGNLKNYKAYVVAKGYDKKETISYIKTLSLVVGPQIIRFMLILALFKGWDVKKLNVNNSFLNGDLQEIFYMKQPSWFEDKFKA